MIHIQLNPAAHAIQGATIDSVEMHLLDASACTTWWGEVHVDSVVLIQQGVQPLPAHLGRQVQLEEGLAGLVRITLPIHRKGPTSKLGQGRGEVSAAAEDFCWAQLPMSAGPNP